jgi:hypothetical protein
MPPTAPAPDIGVRRDVGSPRELRRCLVAFLVAGFALRLGLALGLPTIQRTDEVLQTLEPAYRLVSGWGIVTWEWRDGIRSWLFPEFLAGLMSLAGHIGSGRAAYLPVIAAVLSLGSLGVIATGTLLGWRKAGRVGAVLCGLLCCCWPDLVYFAPKTLEEVQAGNVLIIAIGLAAALPGWQRRAWPCLVVGVLLGLVVCLRFQLMPAVLLVAVWSARRRLASGWLPLLLGMAIPLAVLGVSDQLAWGRPFQSIWLNLYVNLVMGRSAMYGVSPPFWFAIAEARWWGAALLPVVVFFCLGARAAPLPAAVAVVIVLTHSLVGHKEITFIYAAIPPALITAGLGTARAVLAMPALLRPVVAPSRILAGVVVLWAAAMGLTGIADARGPWRGVDDGLLSLTRTAGRQPDLCGLGMYGADFPWNATGGYAWLDRAVPVYLLLTPAELAQAQPGFDELLVRIGLADTLPGWRKVSCTEAFCLLRRPPPCTPVPSLEVNAVLQRLPYQATIPLPAWAVSRVNRPPAPPAFR